MEENKTDLLNLLFNPQLNIYVADYVEDLDDSYREPDGVDSVCLMAETDEKIIVIEAVYRRELSPNEKRIVGELLEAYVLAPQLNRYRSKKQETMLGVPPDVNLPLDSTHEYRELVRGFSFF